MITRRDFFAVMGGGIVIWIVDPEADAQESGGGARRGMMQRMPAELSAWLHIDEQGAVTAYTGKVEVGQNSRTSLTQAVAEELHTPVASIRMLMGDTDLVPFDGGTVGSQTTPRMWPQMRKAGAAAREMLIDLASQKWMIDRASISVVNGKVTAAGKSAGFGELTHGQKLSKTIPATPEVTPAADWKVAGTSVHKVNGREIVTGAHKYSFDMRRPGMLFGKVLYPPQLGAKLVSIDTSAAEAMPGVKVVRDTFKERPIAPWAGTDLVGVVAPDEQTAERALAALKRQWSNVTGVPDSKEVFAHFKKTARGGAVESPDLVPYTVAYIAHTPLEPRAAVAEWDANGKLTVWTGTQRPFGVRSELSQDLGIPEDRVRVIMPDTGSGYGGKHTGDAAIEAARLAKAVGRPVKRNWTREEELTWAYFRPGGLIEVAGRVGPDGLITAWEFYNYNSGPSALQSPYEISNRKERHIPAQTPLRQGSYRGLAGTANIFVRESYMDELAHSIHMDPLEFRLKNAKDERLRNVIQAAAEKFGWKNRQKGKGRGYGIAAGFEKGSYIANCAEVAEHTTGWKVTRAVAAYECGAVVNPDQLRNQVEGAMAMGIGGALFEHIDFADARITTNRLARYRLPRFSDMPVMEAVLLDRKDITSAGAGETPIMAIAPAIGNALFDATGQRHRSLPMLA